jgi:hypothetical protein
MNAIETEWLSKMIDGMFPAVCPLCKAMIAPNGEQEHKDWHERLRRAVDETGTLG